MAKLFGITVDYLLESSSSTPLLALHQDLDEPIDTMSLKNTVSALRKVFPKLYSITPLSRSFRASRLQELFNTIWTFLMPIEFPQDIFTIGQSVSDWSAYFLVENHHRQLLVNLKKGGLVASELARPFVGRVYKTTDAIYRKIKAPQEHSK